MSDYRDGRIREHVFRFLLGLSSFLIHSFARHYVKYRLFSWMFFFCGGECLSSDVILGVLHGRMVDVRTTKWRLQLVCTILFMLLNRNVVMRFCRIAVQSSGCERHLNRSRPSRCHHASVQPNITLISSSDGLHSLSCMPSLIFSCSRFTRITIDTARPTSSWLGVAACV